ncbi:hypothetical protein Ait01nite_097910 [Actinoplanes italicus]|uniref:Helix-turn-helix protein n=1 Tax=Actinoplanes italicus TaxID=113567 RepID=A0A2T0K3E6_9ACTN|nr:helix-turn-helix transcriptional regulator [Actinoplanes italicus]PRX17361.1 helix-turn-helix protein [Actinoplanes italicus]GIE36746.1 hypothetical protein Ait01nite_097910 [Actinoplanes italicus]
MDHDLVEALTRALPGISPEQLAEAVLLASRAADGRRPPRARPRRRAGMDSAGDQSPIAETENSPTADPGPRPGQDLSLDRARNRDRDRPAPPRSADGAGIPVGLRVSRPRRMPLTGALAPFRRITRPGIPAVDVDRTVEAIAEAHQLVVVTTPRHEPSLDVILLVDQTPATPAWAPQINDLESRIRRAGAFRSVTRWMLDGDSGPEPRVRRTRRPDHPAARLADPTGRTLLLIVTDAVSTHWYAPPIWRAINAWARVMPTSLVQILPRRHWSSTAIGAPAVAVRSHGRREGTLAGEVRIPWWADDDTATGRAIPVTSCSPHDLHRWARAVTTASGWTDAVLSRPPTHTGPAPHGSAPSVPQRVQAFQRRASTAALSLARLAAHGDVLSLPLLRVLQEKLVPDADPAATAELLVSGLLERTDPEATRFRFRPGVADLLLQGATLAEEWDSFRVLSEHLEQHAGLGGTVHALLADPAGDAYLERGLRPFAAMTRDMAARLGIDLPSAMAAHEPALDWIVELRDGQDRVLGNGALISDRSAVIVMPPPPHGSRLETRVLFPGLPETTPTWARPWTPAEPDCALWDMRGPAPTEPAVVDDAAHGDVVHVITHVSGRIVRKPAVVGEWLDAGRRTLLTESDTGRLPHGAAVVRPRDGRLIGLVADDVMIPAGRLADAAAGRDRGPLTLRPVGADDGPNVARRRLRLFLREARERAGLTQWQVADAMEWSLSRLIRIENGDVGIPLADLRNVLVFLGVKDRDLVAELLAAARLARVRPTTWSRGGQFRGHMSDAMIKIIEYEAEADEIRIYGIRRLPDLMQTSAYSESELIRRDEDDRPPEWAEVAGRAHARRREQVHARAGDSLSLFALVDEAVLWRLSSRPRMHREQLPDLLRKVMSGAIRMRIVPFAAGAPLYLGDFEVVTMAGDDALYRDFADSSDDLVEDPDVTRSMRRRFDRAWRSALSEEETIAFLRDRIRGAQ